MKRQEKKVNDRYETRRLVALGIFALLVLGGAAAIFLPGLKSTFSVEPQIQGNLTAEESLAIAMERESAILDVISIEMDEEGIYVWVVDLEGDRDWTESERDSTLRAIGVLFDFAQRENLAVGISFFSRVNLRTSSGDSAEVYMGTVAYFCWTELISEYNGDARDTISSCASNPFGLFISAESPTPFIGR